MNKTPSILVDTGFEVDQNGALTEIVTPNVVATLNAPRKVTFLGQTLNWTPATASSLQEIDCPNLTTFGSWNYFNGYTQLTTASFNSLVSIGDLGSVASQGLFFGCSKLTTINMPNLVSIGYPGSTGSGHFKSCTSLINVNMPKLQTINAQAGTTTSAYNIGNFYGCTGLTTLTLPSLSIIGSSVSSQCGVFYGCTGLQSVQLGSEGHPVTSIGNYAFGNCTQSGLTITIYTNGGAALSGSPWGATNATIVWEEA